MVDAADGRALVVRGVVATEGGGWDASPEVVSGEDAGIGSLFLPRGRFKLAGDISLYG